MPDGDYRRGEQSGWSIRDMKEKMIAFFNKVPLIDV